MFNYKPMQNVLFMGGLFQVLFNERVFRMLKNITSTKAHYDRLNQLQGNVMSNYPCLVAQYSLLKSRLADLHLHSRPPAKKKKKRYSFH